MLLKLFILTFVIIAAASLALSFALVWKKPAESCERDNSDSGEVFSCDACGINEPGACALYRKRQTLNNNEHLQYLCISQNFCHQRKT